MGVEQPDPRDLTADGLRIAVVASLFNAAVTGGLIDGARDYLEEAHAEEVLVVHAPGAFELPLIAQRLAQKGYDAVVCLGAVIEGDTDHYEHVAHRTSEGLMRVQLADALERSEPGPENKGREAAIAAVMAARALQALD